MAIFKAPKITTTQRVGLLLEKSEIVYDTDSNLFYGGNGSDLGGFPIGQGASQTYLSYTLTSQDIQNKFITLPETPNNPELLRLNIIGGIEQINSIDFTVSGAIVSWNALGLDSFLEENDILTIQY